MLSVGWRVEGGPVRVARTGGGVWLRCGMHVYARRAPRRMAPRMVKTQECPRCAQHCARALAAVAACALSSAANAVAQQCGVAGAVAARAGAREVVRELTAVGRSRMAFFLRNISIMLVIPYQLA